MSHMNQQSFYSSLPATRPRYVLSLDADDSFAIFDSYGELKEKTPAIDRASRFESMSEANISAFLAGLDRFTVKLHTGG